MEKLTTKNNRPAYAIDPTLVLYLPLWKKDGTALSTDDAYGHACTVVGTGGYWELQGHSFPG